mgnify:FL=1
MITRQAISQKYPVKPLGAVAEFLDNRRKPVKESDRIDGPYPYYGANGQQGNIDGYLFDEPLILLAEDGGFFDNPDRGIAYRISGKTWVNNHAHVLKPKAGMDFDFLCRVLENYDVMPYISGSTRAKLTKGQAEKIDIPVPPLEEQKRIAAILDTDRLNQLGQAIFHEMFGDPIANPNNWPIAKVGELTDCIVPGRDKPKSFTGDIPWITTSEIVHLGHTLDRHAKAALSHDEVREVRARIVPQNSVIMTCVGDLGKISIAGDAMVINQQLHSFQCGPDIDPTFLMYILSHRQGWMARMATQTTLPYMNKTICNSVPIFAPPIELQQSFSLRISFLAEVRSAMNAEADRFGHLVHSLQHRAFEGEL